MIASDLFFCATYNSKWQNKKARTIQNCIVKGKKRTKKLKTAE